MSYADLERGQLLRVIVSLEGEKLDLIQALANAEREVIVRREIMHRLGWSLPDPCVPREGGRRCETHHGLPLYPDGRCRP